MHLFLSKFGALNCSVVIFSKMHENHGIDFECALPFMGAAVWAAEYAMGFD